MLATTLILLLLPIAGQRRQGTGDVRPRAAAGHVGDRRLARPFSDSAKVPPGDARRERDSSCTVSRRPVKLAALKNMVAWGANRPGPFWNVTVTDAADGVDGTLVFPGWRCSATCPGRPGMLGLEVWGGVVL